MRIFWPGPLSVLLSARKDLPVQIRGADGTVCLRWTSHPLAALLSRESSQPLIATSANLSERPPVNRPWDLDELLAAQSDLVVGNEPWPAGGLPSTIVRCEGDALSILRTGAVPRHRLEESGFEILGPVF